MCTILLALCLGTAPDTAAPLVAETAELKLGDIKAGAPLAAEFVLSNRGTVQLHLEKLEASCGCSRAEFERSLLRPGESCRLTVSINTLAQAAGPWAWTAAMHYREGDGQPARALPLRLTGTLIREIEITPPGLAFGLAAGELSQTLTIRDTRPAPLAIRTIATSSPHLAVERAANAPAGMLAFKVTVRDQAPAGESNEVIELTTSDPAYPTLRIPVRIAKRGPRPITVHPDEVQVLLEPGIDAASERVLLRSSDGTPFRIRECRVDDSSIAVEWSREAGAVGVVRLKFPGKLATQPGRATLTIDCDPPVGLQLTVPLEWAGRGGTR